MVGRLIHSAVNFVVLIGLTLLLPLFCMFAWLWGSKDERWLLKVLFCVLSPFCAIAQNSSNLIQIAPLGGFDCLFRRPARLSD